MVIESIAADSAVFRLIERLRLQKGVVHATGLWGSSAPMLAALIARAAPRTYLYITAHSEEADDARDDIELFLGQACELFPAWETLPGEGAGAGEIEAERNRICHLLLEIGDEKAQRHGGTEAREQESLGDPDAILTMPRREKTTKRRSDEATKGASNRPLANAKSSRSPHRRSQQSLVARSTHSFAAPSNRPTTTPSPPQPIGPSTEFTLIVAPIQALMQPVASPEMLQRHSLRLRLGMQEATGVSSPDRLMEWAVQRGFTRLDRVESPGDVAQRGDIVDLFAPGETEPIRIQFDDDRIESIRRFDLSTQRSWDTVSSISITAFPEGFFTGAILESDSDRQQAIEQPASRFQANQDGALGSASEFDGRADTLFDYLPRDALMILDDPTAIEELGRTLESRLGGSSRLFPVADILRRSHEEFSGLHLARLGAASTRDEDVFTFPVTSTMRFEGDAASVVAELLGAAVEREIHVFCDTEGERQRLEEMLAEGRSGKESTKAPKRESEKVRKQEGTEGSELRATGHPLHLHVGLLHRGFEWQSTRTVVLGHHELFRRERQRRRIRRVHAGRPLESWLDLQPGDYVVHVTHGIAVYRGLANLSKTSLPSQPESQTIRAKPEPARRFHKATDSSEPQEEYLTLEFAEQAVLRVPCSQIDLVQKYIGSGGRRPTLSTLGGKRWGKMKEQVAGAVADLAESLLRVQALRGQAQGTPYPADTDWQREFEAAFPYEETEDQLQVAGEIRTDLTRPQPMDRVVCGDVGYGKTELAMRAAFKVIEYGRQVAVLVPTTVLAEQHYETFRARMAEYPFSVGCLSRFRTGAEQKRILSAAKKGQVDVVIGTHRLLSKDVAFADLGLVIIDEEQRFGVEHKEHLKAMRQTVDVLTLTATPIPRTLHMALIGIRDISSLQTPPVDRRSIATYVRPFDRPMIRDAILREMNRDGQVFFVHNFVQSIAAMADEVRSIVPEARVVYAHGQMKDEKLEEVVHAFGRRQADVLVTTTIIESGIDMPSVNTIFINRAERFGLADLHQLRGRVGRSHHRAYCYLLLSPDRPPTGKAAKRLKTIEEFSELGAGFRIAMRDLEIRGAGNLLGKEQSGHIAAVGYEMYCRLLEKTVRRMKGESDPTPATVHVDLGVEAHVPRAYITSDRLRIEAYRRAASCATAADLAQFERDLVDAFGPIPTSVQQLLELSEIRIHARRFGVQSISLRPPDVIFSVARLAEAEQLFAGAAGSVRSPDAKTIHWRPPPAYLEESTKMAILRQMMRKAVAVLP